MNAKCFISMLVTVKRGGGLLNRLINKLPFEAHIPGYRFCGPGTKLEERLARKEEGINPLDDACKEHDIAYAQNKDLSTRHQADKLLADRAWKRVSAPDAGIGEKIAAFAVTNAMKAKVKLGAGVRGSKSVSNKSVKHRTLKKKKNNRRKKSKTQKKHFRDALKAAKDVVRKMKTDNIKALVPAALRAAKNALKGGSKQSLRTPRIIPLPKTGGALPFLVPLFAGLSAVGSLAGGAASIYKAINEVKKSKQQNNSDRVEFKHGKGLYLKPYKQGMGLF